MKRYLPFIIVGVVALATLGSGALLYHAKRPHLVSLPAHKAISGKDTSESIHIRGNPAAPVTLEEYGDYQCPPCSNAAAFLDQVVKEYQPNLKLVFRNLPLPVHRYAREAAMAAEAAGLQGRYWEMHDVLYREQAVWSKTDNARELFDSYAGMLGLNLSRFKKDMQSDEISKRIDSDEARANSLGVKTTPTIFINDQELPPNEKTPEAVRAKIDAALKTKSPQA